MENVLINESGFSSNVKITSKNVDTIEFIACLQEADRPNRNGRVYSKAVLDQGINSPYIKERLATKSLFSECSHPLGSDMHRQTELDVRNSVCIIEEIWWEGNLLKARCETCNTSLGKDFKGLLEQGSIAAFSLRAQGNVINDGDLVRVQSPINIITWDYVVNPSHDKAWLERICESTYNAILNRKNYMNDSMALMEANNMFENGEIISLDEVAPIEATVDYTTAYGKKFKLLDEMYIPNKNDTVISVSDDITILHEGNTTKKVLTEDYIVKDIRGRINAIMSGDNSGKEI